GRLPRSPLGPSGRLHHLDHHAGEVVARARLQGVVAQPVGAGLPVRLVLDLEVVSCEERLSTADRTTRGVIPSSSASANFSTFALFAPDGRTVLTAGTTDNRLQLWRNPVFSPRGRAAELRQYIWADAPTLCAAFAPQAPFAVTGTRDRNVVVWNLPTAEELHEPVANATVVDIGKFLENSTRQVRVIVEVTRKTPGLMPGRTATVVVCPK